MKSTIEKDIVFDDNHVAHIVPKEIPNWYGIEGVGFIWHNEWSDPEIEYKGKRFSCYIVEDTMWERYKEDISSIDEEEFERYMQDNADEVRELCELVLEGM